MGYFCGRFGVCRVLADILIAGKEGVSRIRRRALEIRQYHDFLILFGSQGFENSGITMQSVSRDHKAVYLTAVRHIMT